GGYNTYGLVVGKAESDAGGFVPYGLITPGCKMKKPVKQGERLTLDAVELDTDTLIYRLRGKQDAAVGSDRDN
ncbi:MAG: hypothetical protein FWC72_06610, partial [Oscillospiraceae bacterium]|nr:hypothetical protein [Oscillospiraceae bacterium]